MAFWNRKKALQAADDRGWTRIFDWTPGAWQSHSPYDRQDSVLSYPTVFACTTLIEGDIGKLPYVVQEKRDGIWATVEHEITKLLLKPNYYQNHIQFKRSWMNSKLVHGNTYVLKVRDFKGNVTGLIVLDPLKVTPLVSDMSGEVFYQLDDDDLARIDRQMVVPASEIIHDRFNCLYHPLVGLSPLFACASSAQMGLSIIKNSKGFFENGSSPGGVLTAPGSISDDTAKRLKEYWDANYTGEKSGRVAVLGDGLTYQPMRMTNVDAQLIEHFKWSAETVCSAYHVPAYMVGVGDMPTYNNVEVLTIRYYSQCLQVLIEEMEESLNRGLQIQNRFRIQVDLDALFRMDQSTLTKVLNDRVGGGWMAPDEARSKVNLPPVPGGKYPYLQQQNYSLEALSKRDATNPLAVTEVEPPVVEEEENPEDVAMMLGLLIEKELASAQYG